jgi:ABC-type amino acid transport substrate-binding protein
MFRKGHDALRHAVNRALGDLRTKGIYGQIHGKWFGGGGRRPDPEA